MTDDRVGENPVGEAPIGQSSVGRSSVGWSPAALLRGGGGAVAAEIVFNFVLPLLVYNSAKHDLGDVKALMASSAPPVLWSMAEFVRRRRVDALSILVLAGIVLSLLAFLGGGSVRALQLRDKLVTGLIGLIFLGSAAIGRPLIYQLARARLMRRSASEAASFEARRDNAGFRRTMMVMTLVWGFGLVAEAGLAGALVFRVSINQYLMIGPVVGYGTFGLLTLWTFWYARRQRRRGDARRAAEQAALNSSLSTTDQAMAPDRLGA